MNVGGQVTISRNLYLPSLLTLAGEEHCEAFDTTGEAHKDITTDGTTGESVGQRKCGTKPRAVLKQSYERGEGSNEARSANVSGQL